MSVGVISGVCDFCRTFWSVFALGRHHRGVVRRNCAAARLTGFCLGLRAFKYLTLFHSTNVLISTVIAAFGHVAAALMIVLIFHIPFSFVARDTPWGTKKRRAVPRADRRHRPKPSHAHAVTQCGLCHCCACVWVAQQPAV